MAGSRNSANVGLQRSINNGRLSLLGQELAASHASVRAVLPRPEYHETWQRYILLSGPTLAEAHR